MEQLKLILIFGAVLKHGSMNSAGRELKMSASAISQHIRNLEAYYRVKLLNRNTRSLSPTPAGQMLWEQARKLQALAEETDYLMAHLQAEPSGEVVISLPSGYMGLSAIKQAIGLIQNQYPKILLTFLSQDGFSDLIAENIDIALRTVLPDNPEYIAQPLAEWEMYLCASPDYLVKQSITHKNDLLDCIWLNFSDTVLQNLLQVLELPSALPSKRINCAVSEAHHLVLDGLGVGIFLSAYADEYIQAGKLERILPNLKLPTRHIYAVTTQRSDVAKIRVVLDVLKKCFGEILNKTV